jgi:hypothetical protein
MHFRVWGILRKMGGPRVRRTPVKWSAIAESLRNTDIGYAQTPDFVELSPLEKLVVAQLVKALTYVKP